MVDHGQNFFVGEELVQVLDELLPLHKSGKAEGRMVAGNLVVGELREIVVAEAFEGSLGDRLQVRISAEDNDQAGELSLVFLEVLLVLDVHANAFALHYSVGARGPGFGIDQQRGDIGRGHANVDVLVGPAAAEWSPGLKVRVGETHRGELIAGPLVGALHVRGAGEPLADRVHQSRGELHHLGVAETFVANAAHGFQVHLFLRPQGGDRADHDQKAGQADEVLHDRGS